MENRQDEPVVAQGEVGRSETSSVSGRSEHYVYCDDDDADEEGDDQQQPTTAEEEGDIVTTEEGEEVESWQRRQQQHQPICSRDLIVNVMEFMSDSRRIGYFDLTIKAQEEIVARFLRQLNPEALLGGTGGPTTTQHPALPLPSAADRPTTTAATIIAAATSKNGARLKAEASWVARDGKIVIDAIPCSTQLTSNGAKPRKVITFIPL